MRIASTQNVAICCREDSITCVNKCGIVSDEDTLMCNGGLGSAWRRRFLGVSQENTAIHAPEILLQLVPDMFADLGMTLYVLFAFHVIVSLRNFIYCLFPMR